MFSSLPAIAALEPVRLVVLQGTSFCNLNCTYCDLSAQSRRTRAVMSFDLVERLFAELFRSGRLAPDATVVWHAGEPLTLPPSYYDQAIDLICDLRDRIAGDAVSLRFDFQTNGVLIDESWCEFFRRHESLLEVGVSCDGPPEMHDQYRVNWSGSATAAKTERGMDLLQRYGIKYNVIAVVTRNALNDPDAFFHYFLARRAHLSGFHFNILAEARSPRQDLAYTMDDRPSYYAFFRRLLWLARRASDAGADFEIRNFSQAIARIVAAQQHGAPRHLELGSAPLRSITVDTLGNVTTFYAGLGVDTLPNLYGDGRGLSIGNIREMPFEQMACSEKLQRMMVDFDRSTRFCESSCEYSAVCPGGFQIVQRLALGRFDGGETTECAIHVKTLVDAVLDDIEEHLAQRGQ